MRWVDARVRGGVERDLGRRRNDRSPFEESDGAGGARSRGRPSSRGRRTSGLVADPNLSAHYAMRRDQLAAVLQRLQALACCVARQEPLASGRTAASTHWSSRDRVHTRLRSNTPSLMRCATGRAPLRHAPNERMQSRHASSQMSGVTARLQAVESERQPLDQGQLRGLRHRHEPDHLGRVDTGHAAILAKRADLKPAEL